jgi:acetyl esterase/lipase
VRYITEEMSIPASEVVLAGDSAGEQLIGAIFAQMVKPSPYFLLSSNAKGGKRDRFRAEVMISPFTRLLKDWRTESFKMNEGRDYLTWKQVEEFKEAWGAKDDDVWVNLCGLEGERGL